SRAPAALRPRDGRYRRKAPLVRGGRAPGRLREPPRRPRRRRRPMDVGHRRGARARRCRRPRRAPLRWVSRGVMSPDGASGRPALRVVAPLLLASLVLAGCSAGRAGSREIAVEMHFSRYLPATLTVAAGTTVTFELRNTDPIAHEFVLGTEAEQLAHERGNPDDPHTAAGQAAIPGDRTL